MKRWLTDAGYLVQAGAFLFVLIVLAWVLGDVAHALYGVPVPWYLTGVLTLLRWLAHVAGPTAPAAAVGSAPFLRGGMGCGA